MKKDIESGVFLKRIIICATMQIPMDEPGEKMTDSDLRKTVITSHYL